MPAPEHPDQSATVTPIADRRAARDATGDDPPPSTSDVVTNLSDLTPAMRSVLMADRDEYGLVGSDEYGLVGGMKAQSAEALARRGLLVWVAHLGRWQLTLSGERGRDALIAVRDALATPDPEIAEVGHVYDAVRRALPMATDLARYVAQLRNWATHLSDDGDWERGRGSAYAMIADQLERHVLRELAPLLRPEATRRYREGQTRG